MNKVPDRAKKRREYLLKKWQAYILSILAIIFAVPLLWTGAWLFGTIGASLLTAIVAGLGLIPIIFSHHQIKQAAALPYVPPVHDQIVALPDEEVLLRGSEATKAAPEELLRPSACLETPSEALLRASQEHEGV